MAESKTVIIRDAGAGDQAAAVAVTVAAYEQYAGVMPAFAWERYRQNIVETLQGRDNGELIVAEWDGHIVGSVKLMSPPRQAQGEPNESIGPQTTDVPEMRLLAVSPDARGHGIGHRLTEECIQRTRAQGYSSMTLHTHEMMAVAMNMYERMGFVRAPELDYSPVEGALVKGYRLEL